MRVIRNVQTSGNLQLINKGNNRSQELPQVNDALD